MKNEKFGVWVWVCLLWFLVSAQASAVAWKAVTSEPSQYINIPGTPTWDTPVANAADRYLWASISEYDDSTLNWLTIVDNGAYDTFRFYINGADGYSKVAAELRASGVVGPGRSGSQASNVFRSLYQNYADQNHTGDFVFNARAGNLNDDIDFATYGTWLHDASAGKNIEIARGGVTGALGPGLSEWTFCNRNEFAEPYMLEDGRLLLNARVVKNTSGTCNSSSYSQPALVVHTPGQGNQMCLLSYNTGALGPNIGTEGKINKFHSLAWSKDNRIFAYMDYYTTDSWRHTGVLLELCNGGNRPVVMLNTTGINGPSIAGKPNAVFKELGKPHPINGGEFYFFADYKEDAANSASSSRTGLFFHQADGKNLLVATSGATDSAGPNFLSTTFNSFNSSFVEVNGSYVVFHATINLPTGTTKGLWRAKRAGAPEPLAIVNYTGNYKPVEGRKWDDLGAFAIFPGGGVAVFARTVNDNGSGSEKGLWLIHSGSHAEKLLANGTKVVVPNVNGTTSVETVGSFGEPSFQYTYPTRGWDGWASDQGYVRVFVRLANKGNADVVILGQVSDPAKIFGGMAGGFE